MRYSRLAACVVLMVVLAGCAHLSGAASRTPTKVDVPITLMETAGVARVGEPVSVGVPMPRNLLTAAGGTGGLYLLGPDGKQVPAQYEVLMKWFPTEKYPKAAGTRWVLVDFLADVPANGKATYRLRRQLWQPSGKPLIRPQPESPVVVKDAGDVINVSTGPLKFAINKKTFRLFDKVELGGKTVVDASATDGLCVEGMDG